MKKLRKNFRTILASVLCLATFATAEACDRSSLSLTGITPLAGGQFQINMQFSCGAGQTGLQRGGDQPTGDFGFFISGAELVSYPGSMTSPLTGAVYTSTLAYSDTILVYENGLQWWACVDNSCGGVQTVTANIQIVTQGLPNNIVLLGMEGGGTIFGCDGPDMTIDFTCSGITASAGPDAEVFPAYFPASCTTLNASGSGGSGNYSYAWSTGATTASINVCPSVTTTYTVTVTDNLYLCSKVDQVVVTATNITCGNNKLLVCQNGNTRCVPRSQVAGILANGGTLGPCKNKTEAAAVVESSETNLQVGPNPAHGAARAFISLADAADLNLALYDINGRLVKSLANGAHQAGEHTVEIDLNGLAPGLYVARMSAGQQTYTQKLMVQ